MTTTTKVALAATTSHTPVFAGKGSKARLSSFLSIAPLAFAEDSSRVACVANMRSALGSSPDDALIGMAKLEYQIGRFASRTPASELPKGSGDADRLEYARRCMTQMASPAKEGIKARKLRAGQIGRRTPTQEKRRNAAIEACSVFFAELGLSNAATNGTRNATKKGKTQNQPPVMAGSGKGKAQVNAPMIADKAQPVTSDGYVQHMQVQLAALCAFDAKHAKKRPTTHGAFAEGLLALRQIGNKAANDYQVRKAEAEAKADNAAK